MSELQIIETALVKASRRRRLSRALRGLWVGLLVGASTWLLTFGLYKVLPVPASVLWDPLESTCRHASLSIL